MSAARSTLLAAVALCIALPAEAQWRRGTVEAGAFGSFNRFDDDLRLDDKAGVGLRAGVFLSRRWSLEAEGSYSDLDRFESAGRDESYTPFYARFNFNAPVGNHAFVLGAGLTRTDYTFTHNYGPSALAGFRLMLGPNVFLRADAVADYLPAPDPDIWNTSLRAGLGFFRFPFAGRTIIESRGVIADTSEILLLRERLLVLQATNDSLLRAAPRVDTVMARSMLSAEAMTTLQAPVFFAFDESTLDDEARRTLDEKVSVLGANPDASLQVTGHADARGGDDYNFELGYRRAMTVRDYLVGQGVGADRLVVATAGEERPVAAGSDEIAWQQNRRANFHMLEMDARGMTTTP